MGEGRGPTTMTATVVALVALAFALTSLMRPHIPRVEPDARLLAQGEFVANGADQPVRWVLAGPDALRQSRQDGKPLLIVASRLGSPGALQADDLGFRDLEMAEQINRLFVPVRIDLDQDPEWESILLPFRRLEAGAETGFDLFVVEPEAGLAAWLTRSRPGESLSFSVLADFLKQARREAEKAAPPLAGALQVEWSRSRMPPGSVSLEKWGEAMEEVLMRRRGLAPYGDRVEIEPILWSALIADGHDGSALWGLQGAVSSPMMDGVRGLLSSYGESPEGEEALGIYGLVPNAEAAAAAARLAVITGDASWRLVAHRIVEGIERELLDASGAASTLSDEEALAPVRPFSAITPAQMEGSLSEEEADEARRVFGLDPSVHRRMTPFPRDWTAWAKMAPSTSALRDRLRSLQDERRLRRGGVDTALSTCLAAARMLETGFLLEDSQITSFGDRLYRRAQMFRTGADGLVNTRRAGAGRKSSLASKLAFADASYWAWVAMGDTAAVHDGLAVLDRAWTIYSADGELRSSARQRMELFPEQSWPLGWVDGLRPSDAGLALSVTRAYALAFDDSSLAARVERLASGLGPLLSVIHPKTAGLARGLTSARKCVAVNSRLEIHRAAALSGPLPILSLEGSTRAKTSAAKSP